MKEKVLMAAILLSMLIAAIIFGHTLNNAVFNTEPSDTSTPAALFDAADDPAVIKIPSLDITATVQSVGINAKGNMASPTNFTDVGWYRNGTRPGALGSAVIAGHLDNGLALSGVFKHLSEIHIHDQIIIETKSKEQLVFVVIDIERYPYLEAPTDFIFNRNDKARLNIITCSGSWVPKDKTYDERIVVFSELVSTSTDERM